MGLADLFQAVVDVATLPVAIVKDIITLGENQETKKKIEDIGEDLDNAIDD